MAGSAGTFRIGGDLEVGRLGFGAMQLPARPADARAESVAVARRAVELGVTLIDTAHLYGGGANEELLAEALYPYPEGLLITTKVGVARSAETGEWGLDGRPEVLREQVDHALRRLRVERIELLQLHRIDPEVDLAEQLGALRELQEAGKVARLGLSEVTAGELARARELVDVASVQNRYSVGDREHEAVLRACTAAGIAFLPWRPVLGALPPAGGTDGDGAGNGGAADAGAPEAPYRVIGAVARELGATPVQVALAWLLAHSPVVLPIPGTAKLGHLQENVAAAGVRLEQAHLDRLNRLSHGA